MDSLMLLLFMSDSCHRHCDHCYAQASDSKMSKETAGDVGRWIANVCKEDNVKHLHVSLAGGEPTNNIESVFHLHDVLNEELPTHKNQMFFRWEDNSKNFHLHTNGDLLTDDMLRELKARTIGVKLNPTYDSLEEIENKMIKIKSICKGVTLALALNEVNLPRLPEITKLALKHRSHMRTNRLYDGGCIPGYVDEYAKQMGKAFDLLLESEWTMWPNWIMESTFPTWEGPKNPYSCGKWWAVLGTDGTIRSCNPDYDTNIGSIYTHLHWKDLKFPQRWSAKNLPECQGCEWITWCQGGCPYTRKLAYGTYNHATPFCPAFKKLWPKVALLTNKWIEKNKGIFECARVLSEGKRI